MGKKLHFSHARELSCNVDKSKFKLRQVQVVFRHGARGPIQQPKCFPHFEYAERLMKHDKHTFIPYKLVDANGRRFDLERLTGFDEKYIGQLTKAGAQQLHNLGNLLRNEYIKKRGFISGVYNEDEFKMYCTKVLRTVESARSLLSGLFPKHFDGDIPIEIYSPDDKDELIAPHFKNCHFLEENSLATWNNPDLVNGLKEIKSRLQKLMGISEKDETFHVVLVRDCLHSFKFHGVLPSQYDSKEILELAEYGAVQVMKHMFCGPESGQVQSDRLMSLSVGRLVRLILTAMKRIKDENKMILYSSHDTALIPLLNMMKVYDSTWPPYASFIIFELYEKSDCMDEEDRYVRVIFNDKVLNIPGSWEGLCRFDRFEWLMGKYALNCDQYKNLCAHEYYGRGLKR